jgi:hypothetical protein
LALGWTFKKYGVEACILIHVIFNTILMIISPYLITVQ